MESTKRPRNLGVLIVILAEIFSLALTGHLIPALRPEIYSSIIIAILSYTLILVVYEARDKILSFVTKYESKLTFVVGAIFVATTTMLLLNHEILLGILTTPPTVFIFIRWMRLTEGNY